MNLNLGTGFNSCANTFLCKNALYFVNSSEINSSHFTANLQKIHALA